MTANRIDEVVHGTSLRLGEFAGNVRDIQQSGFGWTGTWYDETNKNDRKVRISIDDPSQGLMTIVESGGGGDSPTQKWKGNYRVSNGNVYSMQGTLIEQDNQPQQDKFDIYVTNLTLPS